VLIVVRSVLALTVFVASLGVVTSGRLPVPREVRITSTGSGPEPGFTAIVHSPVRWSPAAHQKRPAPLPIGGRTAFLGAPSPTPFPAGWIAIASLAPTPHVERVASGPASPRAPPRRPA
jgi:hypothetical protein